MFIRRVADDIELSWSGAPVEFTREGLAFESSAGHARVPVREVAETILRTLEWAVNHPPESPAQYRDKIAALQAKVDALRNVEYLELVRTCVPPGVLERAIVAFDNIGQTSPLEGNQAAEPYINELPPAVAMFGGVSPDLSTHDVTYLMPRALVLMHLRDANHIEKSDVQHLASELQVNESALLRHLRNLGLIDDVDRDRLRDRSA